MLMMMTTAMNTMTLIDALQSSDHITVCCNLWRAVSLAYFATCSFPTGAFEFSRFGTFWFAIFCHLFFPWGAFDFKDSKICHILVWLAARFGLFCHLLHSSSRVDIRLVWSVWGWDYFQIWGHYMVANIRSFNSDSWTLLLTDRGSEILSFLWSNFLLVTFPNF